MPLETRQLVVWESAWGSDIQHTDTHRHTHLLLLKVEQVASGAEASIQSGAFLDRLRARNVWLCVRRGDGRRGGHGPHRPHPSLTQTDGENKSAVGSKPCQLSLARSSPAHPQTYCDAIPACEQVRKAKQEQGELERGKQSPQPFTGVCKDGGRASITRARAPSVPPSI